MFTPHFSRKSQFLSLYIFCIFSISITAKTAEIILVGMYITHHVARRSFKQKWFSRLQELLKSAQWFVRCFANWQKIRGGTGNYMIARLSWRESIQITSGKWKCWTDQSLSGVLIWAKPIICGSDASRSVRVGRAASETDRWDASSQSNKVRFEPVSSTDLTRK